MPRNNSNRFSRAIGGVMFPVKRLRDVDVRWLQAWGGMLAKGPAPRLGQWLADWADRAEFTQAFDWPAQPRHVVARPSFEEWSDGELAEAGRALDIGVHMKLPVMAGKLLDRLQIMLGLETRRRQRLMHIAMQTAALKPGESVVVDGRVYFAMPDMPDPNASIGAAE